MLKELVRWPDHIRTFKKELGRGETEILPSDVHPVLAYSESHDSTLKTLTWKNFQAALAGLVYVLEVLFFSSNYFC